MKVILGYLLLGLVVMFVILYVLGWFDLIVNDMLTGNLLTDVKKSFEDYLGVLYYFRYIILIGTIIFALIFYGIRVGIEKLK